VEDTSSRPLAFPKILPAGISTNPRLVCSVRMAFITLKIQSFESKQKKHFRYFSDAMKPAAYWSLSEPIETRERVFYSSTKLFIRVRKKHDFFDSAKRSC
jgi:hypothetical protein